MDELLRSLALFRPETALTAGLLLVVIADSIGGAWRNAAVRVLTVASLAAALGFAFGLQAAGAEARSSRGCWSSIRSARPSR